MGAMGGHCAEMPLSLTRVEHDIPEGEGTIKSTPILNTI